MVWPRYLLYFVGIALIAWMLTQLEISFPGSLHMQLVLNAGDALGTSEFSPVELIQPLILAACGLLMAWVGRHCSSQRPIAAPFGAIALIFLIRELDYFIDRFVINNLGQVLIAVVCALAIVYTYRHRRRLWIAWGRVWPSPGLALIFAGAIVLFAYVHLVGQESFWMALLGDDYRRVIKLAVEEFFELIGYLMWLIGTIEYTYQAKAIAYREPKPAAQRLRQKRRQDKEGQY
jgi:hypothetical protein